ncbi:MAG: hypothetical protein ACREPS_02310 [Rhodanobacteraceae bacterium]
MIRKFLFIAAIALLGTLGLSACNNNKQASTTTEAKATRPNCATGAPDCMKGWQDYLSQVVQDNMGDITNNPYMYFVPAVGTSAAATGTAAGPASASSAAETLSRVQDQIDTVVAATVLPGNMIAAGGPSSSTTAQVLESAFKQASPGSFKGVVVLFIGDKADEAAVKQAVDPSGATFKFAQM